MIGLINFQANQKGQLYPMPGTEWGAAGWYQHEDLVYHYSTTDGNFTLVPATAEMPNMMAVQAWRKMMIVSQCCAQMENLYCP